MDTELKCNRLTCRNVLNDKAVVTTCSHIFCVDCANELFNASRLCPACESLLSEPDDVVVCSLHPSNDYKTSVLSGLTPSIILEICSRAIAFWQYQIHQENTFQQAVLRNLNDKNSQLQKQIDSVIREANGEIALLNNKRAELERDLEIEKRKVRDLQEANREAEKEYQKLKAQHDKIKRKAVLAPSLATNLNAISNEESRVASKSFSSNVNAVDIGAVVGGMEATGIQRTPLVNRTATFPGFQRMGGGTSSTGSGDGQNWAQANATSNIQHPQQHPQHQQHRAWPRGNLQQQQHKRPAIVTDPGRSGYTSDRSASANEVEDLLVAGSSYGNRISSVGWQQAPLSVQYSRPSAVVQFKRVFPVNQAKRTSGTFRPARVPGSR